MQQSNKTIIKKDKITIPNAILIPEVVKCLEKVHTVTLPLRGISMRPFLEDGRDKALLSRPHDVKVGDPVLAEVDKDFYVLHRIVAIDGEKVTLQGDGNLGCEHCTLSDILASVEGFYRKGRTKLDRTDGRKWRIYSKIWMTLRPLRRWLLAFYNRIWKPIFGEL